MLHCCEDVIFARDEREDCFLGASKHHDESSLPIVGDKDTQVVDYWLWFSSDFEVKRRESDALERERKTENTSMPRYVFSYCSSSSHWWLRSMILILII